MMTRQELGSEFWMLTQGVLQDSKIDTDEARVLKRWLEEHSEAGDFSYMIGKLNAFLEDGYVDRFESQEITEGIGNILRTLRTGT